MEHETTGPPASAATGGDAPRSGADLPRRIGLWRAIAGMAMAAALALAIVSIELAHQLTGRSNRLYRRIEQLTAHVRVARRELANAKREARSPEMTLKRLQQILAAPDAKVVRFTPLHGTSGNGLMIASESIGDAALEFQGLSNPPAGRAYVLWCEAAKGRPAKAAEFTATDGAIEMMSAPPGSHIARCYVTIEAANSAEKPIGPVLMRGRVE